MSETLPKAVYVISDEKGQRKIGISNSMKLRLVGIQATGRRGLCVVATYPRENGDARLVERVAHRLLTAKRIRGEWFDVTDEQAIAAVQEAIRLVDIGDMSIIATPEPKPNPIPSTRKSVTLPNEMWEAISDYQLTKQMPTEAEAIRHLMDYALEAAAKAARKGKS